MDDKEPYIGSVKFFKNMILLACIIAVIIPTVFAIFWHSRAVKNSKAEQSAKAELQAYVDEQEQLAESEAAEEAEAEKESPDAIDYQELYPDFYVSTPLPEVETPEKVAYLTFDDGPSDNTDTILEILDEENIKATFFVVGRTSETDIARMKKIAAAGHTIGMHSYSHDYATVYSSVEDFLADFYKLFTFLRDEVGVTPEIFRFPGGSLNNYDQGVYEEIIAEMLRRGFRYYDWNLSAQDAASPTPSAQTILDGILGSSANKKYGVILMHDSGRCKTTVEALPELISGLREQGYTFDKLDRTVRQISFSYRNKVDIDS